MRIIPPFGARPLLCAALLLPVWPATAAAAPALEPGALADEQRLGAVLWEHNPEIRRSRQAQSLARNEAARARGYENPELELGGDSLPLSGTLAKNPGETYDDVPFSRAGNYSVALTQPLDLWRRDLRIARAGTGVDLARQETRGLLQERTADLLGVVAQLAVSRQRVALLDRQIASMEELRRVTAVGVKAAYVPPLDAEKLEVEAGRLRNMRDQAQLEVEQARAEWTRLTRLAAPSLEAGVASTLLARLATPPETWPDEQALVAAVPEHRQHELERAQAETDLALAERRRLPDTALRFGYTYDTLSGNVAHSLQSSLVLGLPVWNAGQWDREEAQIRSRTAEESREALVGQRLAQARLLRARASELERMLGRLQTQHLAAAKGTLERVEGAVKKRLIPLSEAIQLRRTVLDLEGDRLDLQAQLATTLIDYRRLLSWRLPEPPETN